MADEDRAARRRRAERRGHLAELIAAAFLLLKGYRIQALRYRTPLGEIDIIARKADLAVFIEVKSRSDRRTAIDAVGFETQRRIRAASDIWLARQSDATSLSSRFDIIAVSPRRWPAHFPDAF